MRVQNIIEAAPASSIALDYFERKGIQNSHPVSHAPTYSNFWEKNSQDCNLALLHFTVEANREMSQSIW